MLADDLAAEAGKTLAKREAEDRQSIEFMARLSKALDIGRLHASPMPEDIGRAGRG